VRNGQHFRRHGHEFKAKSADEYEQMAAQFASRKNEPGVESFISKGGLTFVYEKITDNFLIQKDNGELMTFFKPSSATYWFDQRMKHGTP
jgi:pyocin large subunit-like protein